MKKIVLLLSLLLLLTGCVSSNVEKEKETYINYIKELKSIEKSTKDIPFDIDVRFDKIIDEEVRYQIVIDNVKEDIYNLEAVAIHNKETDDVFPSIGIFDDKQDLKKNKKPSGVILVGYIDYEKDIRDFKCKIKVYIKYKTKDNKIHKVYYVTKK